MDMIHGNSCACSRLLDSSTARGATCFAPPLKQSTTQLLYRDERAIIQVSQKQRNGGENVASFLKGTTLTKPCYKKGVHCVVHDVPQEIERRERCQDVGHLIPQAWFHLTFVAAVPTEGTLRECDTKKKYTQLHGHTSSTETTTSSAARTSWRKVGSSLDAAALRSSSETSAVPAHP